MRIIPIKEAIPKALKRATVDHDSIANFRKCLSDFLTNIDDSSREKKMEGFQRDFLTGTFYGKYAITKPDDNNIDCAIGLTHAPNSPVAVIIENKTPSNFKEMITADDPNRKAMQELVYYYLIERIEKNNTDVRHLIATNMYEAFIFDAPLFEKLFYDNNKLCREFSDFQAKKKPGQTTDVFYNIASRYIAEVVDKIECIYIDLRNYRSVLSSKDDTTLHKLIMPYKLLCDTYMMKLPVATDYNTLDTAFYREMLYIIGLKEVETNGTAVLAKIDRQETNGASLMDLTEDFVEKKLYYFDKRSDYGDTPDVQLFNIALELCITWVNRLLFLRLLESQIVRYHDGDKTYKILGNDRIENFQTLNQLFFDVLAVDYPLRKGNIRNSPLGHVPYLNSSLFELTFLENRIVTISALPNNTFLPFVKASVLHKQGSPYNRMRAMPTLKYLLSFLDSYRFAGQEEGEIENTDTTLINASVLGMFFEKINGHKDGAVFTPSFITSAMARPAVERAITRKFNETYKDWNCKNFTELANRLDRVLDRDITIGQANDIFNSIHIADISVGSGHFLVSVLGEMIKDKFRLGILTDSSGKVISHREYDIDVVNDELTISTAEGTPFRYIPGRQESQRIQEAIFHEKQTLIENCLFGVDISSNSVGICRLRLWIELLKNTYYTEESQFEHLKTLPNLDINIKQGDSLLSKYDTNTAISSFLRETHIKVSDYKELVAKYKTTAEKQVKRQIEKQIKNIKDHIKNGLSASSKVYRDYKNASLKILDIQEKINFFKLEDSPEAIETINKLEEELIKQSKTVAINKEKVEKEKEKFEGSFEWRFEFPEILREDGKFIGFDLIIGNPPYIQLQTNNSQLADHYDKLGYKTFRRSGDIYCLFFERTWKLLADGGQLSLITSNKWLKVNYGKPTRKFIGDNLNPIVLLDFGANNVFENASVLTDIIIANKEKNKHETLAATVPNVNRGDLPKAIKGAYTKAAEQSFEGENAWLIADPIDISIKKKMEEIGTPLIEKGYRLNYGIKTGKNEVFIISSNKRHQILSECKDEDERQRTEKIIRKIIKGEDIRRNSVSWNNQWLIYIPWHFPYQFDETITGASTKAEQRFASDYPAIYQYLITNKEKLSNRNKAETGIRYEWYALQRWGAKYWQDFDEDKIVWGNLNLHSSYALDKNKYLINAPANQIVPASRALLNLLNSHLADWYIRQLGVTRNGGYFEYKPMFVGKLPIPDDFSCLESLNDESQINQEVYRLYKLPKEYSDYIEANT